MPTSNDFSAEDEAYLANIAAEPKMTMDEVGADIDEHGHVPVTPETATQDPFTAKGSLANALDNCLSADTDLEATTMTRDTNDPTPNVNLSDPTNDRRDESKGDVEGVTDTPHNNYVPPPESEPTVQQDSMSHHLKDSLAYALDSIAMDAMGEHPTENKEMADYSEENASHIPQKAPDIPESLGGDPDKPDENGLVYVSATFTIDPEKYISNNYKPKNPAQPDMKDAGKIKAAPSAEEVAAAQATTPKDEAEISDVGTPEDKGSNTSKNTEDEAPEKVVLDYATFIDGSSFMCFDEVSDIDYTKIAMDAGPKKIPTKKDCDTTFAQCRAKNPLFCRFHGPKLLEADIKTAIKATVGPGCVVSVTKDKNAASKFTFRLTVGCPPAKKKMVEKMIHMYLTQNPGITSSTEDWVPVDKDKQSLEFDMDILLADKPPEKKDFKGQASVFATKKAAAQGKKMAVVGQTPSKIEKAAAAGGVVPQEPEGGQAEETEVETAAEETPQGEEVETKTEEVVTEPIAEEPQKEAEAKATTKQTNGSEVAETPAPAKPSEMADFPMAEDEEFAEVSKGYDSLDKLFTGFSTNKDGSFTLQANPHKTSAQIKSFAKKLKDAGFDAHTVLNSSDDFDLVVKPKTSENAGGDNTQEAGGKVLPAPSSASKAEGESENEVASSPHLKNISSDTKEYLKKYSELSSKMSDLLHHLTQSDMTVDLETSYNLDLAHQCKEAINSEIEAIDGCNQELAELEESTDKTPTEKAVAKQMLEAAKGTSEDHIEDLVSQMAVHLDMGDGYIRSEEEKKADAKKGQYADDVETIVKAVASTLFPNGPVEGVDSAKEMLDTLVDKMEYEMTNLVGAEECEKIIKEKGVSKMLYMAKNDAANFDAAIEAFKDAMDGGSMEEIKNAVVAVYEKGGSLQADYINLKAGCESCKTEAEQKHKLEQSKKRLAESNEGTSQGGTKKPTPEEWDKASKELEKKYGGWTVLGQPDALESAEWTMGDQVPLEKGNQEVYKQQIAHLATAFGVDSPVVQAMVKAYKSHPQYDMTGLEQYEMASGGSGSSEEVSEKVLSDCGDAISKHLGHDPNSDEWKQYYTGELSKILSGDGYPSNIDKKDSSGYSRRDMAKMYLSHIKMGNISGFESVEAALQKIIDTPAKGKKKETAKPPKPPADSVKGDEASEEGVESYVTSKEFGMTMEDKKAKIAAMSPKQKLKAAVKIFKKKLAANPDDAAAKAKLAKYESALAKMK